VKIKGFISLGGLQDERTEEFEIPDKELEGLDAEARDRLIYSYLEDALYQYIDMWYEEVSN
jgi:hypothetical protein